MLKVQALARGAWLALAVALVSCSDPISGPADSVELSGIRITAFTTGTSIATLVVEVSAADIAVPLVFNLGVDGVTGIASGTIKVPPGDDRTFEILAYDALGEITHEGSTTVDVRPGTNPGLQVKLGPRAGQVPITVSFGSFSVIVTPAEASLAPGEAVQLTAVVLDEDGLPVTGAAVSWATSAPWSASVAADGIVTGALAGTAQIVATYEGVAGVSLLTVTGTAIDADADGFPAGEDCDDSDATVFPGATEVVDGKDNDCNGDVDDTLAEGIVFLTTGTESLDVIRPGGTWSITPELAVGVSAGQPTSVDYSPDGADVVFAAEGHLYRMSVAGGSLTQLTSSGADDDPSWSPNGTQIAFSRKDAFGVWVVHVMNASGGGSTPLADGRHPDWSPDGTRLVYSARQIGSRPLLHVMNADGTASAQIFSTGASSGEWDPAWSPDGTRIAFRIGCLDEESEGCRTTDLAELHVGDVASGDVIQITSELMYDASEPAWSPDSERVVYRRIPVAEQYGGMLYLRNADGSGIPSQYGSTPGQHEPSWAATAIIP